jgi:hypothetical protein
MQKEADPEKPECWFWTKPMATSRLLKGLAAAVFPSEQKYFCTLFKGPQLQSLQLITE